MSRSREYAAETPNRVVRLLVVALLILGVVGTGMGPAAAVATASRPFVASVSGALEPTGETTFELGGAGGALHIGPAGYEATVAITSVDPDTGVITDVLVETFSAPNGDTLTIKCHQVAEPVGPGVYAGNDEWSVIGGTGRFSGATGSGTGQTSVDLNNGTFTKVLIGTISY
jgi:hypothetical protein